MPPAILFAIAAAMGALLLVHRIETGGDNLDFMLMARSIQLGQWAEVIQWPRPVGYALMSIAALSLFGLRLDAGTLFYLDAPSILVLKSTGVLLFALSAVAVYAWARRILGDRRWAFALGLLFATNQHVAPWASVIGAEALFILLAFLSLFLWESYAQAESPAQGRRFLWLFVPAAIACMYAKHQGLMVGASFGVWVLLFRRRGAQDWAAGMVLLAFFLLSIGMMIFGNPFCLTHVVSADPYKSGEQISWLYRIGMATRIYSLSWANLVVPKIVGSRGLLEVAGLGRFFWAAAAPLVLLVATGLVASLRRAVRPSHVFLLCFYAMLFAWPDFLFRYLVPMLPFGLWFLIEAIRALLGAWERRRPSAAGRPWAPRALTAIFVALVAWNLAVNAFAGVKNWRNIVRLRHLPAWAPERYRISREDDFADFIEGCQWFRDHAEPNAVFFSRKALFAELAAGRHSEYYSAFHTPDALWDAMVRRAEHRPTYVLRDTFHPGTTYGRIREQLLTPLLHSRADQLALVHRFDSGAEIYLLSPGGPR
jgi:hypothetical protein